MYLEESAALVGDGCGGEGKHDGHQLRLGQTHTRLLAPVNHRLRETHTASFDTEGEESDNSCSFRQPGADTDGFAAPVLPPSDATGGHLG